MNHKLRVPVRLNLDPGRVTVEGGGRLAAQANFPVLLPLTFRARAAATGLPAGPVETGSAS